MKAKKKYGNNVKYFDEDKWEKVHEENKNMMEEFLSSKRSLSDASLKQYKSSLTIFFLFVLDNLQNKFIVDLKKRDILRFQNWMLDEGLSPNSAKTRRSHVSSLCNYIIDYYEDEYESFKNITRGVEQLNGERVHDKIPLTPEELDLLREKLKEQNRWQELAYLEISYSTGARRAEVQQLKKEIVHYRPNDKGFYETHELRAKGRGKQGLIRSLFFSELARESMEKWLEVRGEDDCEYLFVTTNKDGERKQVNETTFNYWCSAIFSKIINRRMNPHNFRVSRASHIVTLENKDISSAQNLLGHASSETTELYVIRDEAETLNDCF